MNIRDLLKHEGFHAYFHDQAINAYYGEGDKDNDIEFDQCTHIYMRNIESRKAYSIKLPKKTLTVEYIIGRFSTLVGLKNTNCVKLFRTIIGKESLNLYAASYGVGISNIWNPDKNKSIKRICDFLVKHGIEYKTDYSNAHWIFRIRISQSRGNLDKFKAVII